MNTKAEPNDPTRLSVDQISELERGTLVLLHAKSEARYRPAVFLESELVGHPLRRPSIIAKLWVSFGQGDFLI